MKNLVKALLVLGLAIPVSGVAVYAISTSADSFKGESATITETGGNVIMSSGDYTFTLTKRNLRFSISKGAVSFSSGETLEEDEEITSLRAGLLESAVSVWSLNSNAGESSFAIFDANHVNSTKVSVEKLENLVVAHVTTFDGKKADPSISLAFDIEYALTTDGLSISLANLEQVEGSNVISALALYPGFNMSYKHVDGHYLIPDGSGALIDLSKPTSAKSPLSMRTYGKDIGISTGGRTLYSSEQLAYPMFAQYEPGKAMMVTVEEGEEYSELNTKVAGIYDNYNISYFRFILRDTTYQYYGLSESSRKPVPQAVANAYSPRLHYHLYDEDLDYSGIAKKYQRYLLDKGILSEANEVKAKMRLEFLMADSKKALFGKEYVRMSSADFIKERMNGLLSERKDFTLDLKGFSSNGYEGCYPQSFPVDGRLGDLNGLTRELRQNEVEVNYRVDLMRSFSSDRGDLGRNMSQKLISTSDYVDGGDSTFYRLTPKASASMLQGLSSDLQGIHASGADFTSIGFDLYSTHYREIYTRSDAIKLYQEAMRDFPLKRSIRKPNLYALPFADELLESPLSCSNFLIETESVPFQSLVLSGYKPLYGPSLNLYELGAKGVLRLVENNIYPVYLLTENSAMDLVDSPASSYLCSSKYEVWEEEMKATYDLVIKTLKQVEGKKYFSHKKLSSNVYLSEYESGLGVVVNYGSSSYSYGGKEVAANSCEVISL